MTTSDKARTSPSEKSEEPPRGNWVAIQQHRPAQSLAHGVHSPRSDAQEMVQSHDRRALARHDHPRFCADIIGRRVKRVANDNV